MIETSQALAALKDADPAIDERALPDTAWSTSDLLQEVARRTDMQTRELKHVEPVKTSPPPRRSRGPSLCHGRSNQ